MAVLKSVLTPWDHTSVVAVLDTLWQVIEELVMVGSGVHGMPPPLKYIPQANMIYA